MKKIFTLIFTLCALMCSCSTPEMEKAEAIKSEVLSRCLASIRYDLLRPQTLTVSEVSEIVCEIDDPTVIVKSREMYWIKSIFSEDAAKEYLDENVSDLEILKSNGCRFYMATVSYYAKNVFDDEIYGLGFFIVPVKFNSNGDIEDALNLDLGEISSKLHDSANALLVAENFANQDKTFYDVVEQYGLDLNFPSRVRKTFTIPKEYRR